LNSARFIEKSKRMLTWEGRLLRNRFRRLLYKAPNHKFLFILSPPHSGSTLLSEVLSLSENVSENNPVGTREGQQLPEVAPLLFRQSRRWEPDFKPDWPQIKRIWLKYWDVTRPVLLEKSPPNIVRAAELSIHFVPAFFIVLYRNPYAHCEGMMRRNKVSAREAARVSMRCLDFQRKNLEQLDRVVRVSYEELTDRPAEVLERFKQLLPELGDIRLEGQTFSAHNFLNRQMGLKNLNAQKIERIPQSDLTVMNEVFRQHAELLDYFGYVLIED